MRKTLTDYSDEPIYNMKAVEQQTGIAAPTLRAWERRHQLIEPKRTISGYRLYSERDVALLRWIHERLNEGLTIGRIAAMLENRAAEDPIWIDTTAVTAAAPVRSDEETPATPASLITPLYEALIDLNYERAGKILEQAFALYTTPTVYVEVITPTLVELGEAWHRGEILISTEHFATTYLRGRLLGLFHAYPNRSDAPLIMVGCAPNEQHEIGAMIFAVMLRQEGMNVAYFGQDVPLDDLVKSAAQEHAAILCLSASSPATANGLRDLQARLDGLRPRPLFCFGGRAFDSNPSLREAVPGHYLGSDPRQSIAFIYQLLQESRS